MITDEAFRQAVKAAIAEHKKDRNIAFTWEGQTYWIKRRLSNGRNQFAKSSVNVQFYTEVARSTIAHRLTGLSRKSYIWMQTAWSPGRLVKTSITG